MNANTEILIKACQNLKIDYKFIHESKTLIKVFTKQESYFSHSRLPFNSAITHELIKDKDYSYSVLKDIIKIPKYLSILDPNVTDEYKHFLKYRNYDEVINAIERELAYPLIIKPNRGSLGRGVRICKNREELIDAMKNIFNKESQFYDYIFLAQELIQRKQEYRVIVFKGKIKLIYAKDITNASFSGNVSPFKHEGAKAIIADDVELTNRINDFIKPVFSEINLEYGGFDIMEDTNDDLWLIEINGNPGYSNFIRDNGEELVVRLFEDMLKAISN